ncbi:hypothetical protein JNK13_06850 [bacterium]|nr:hypothetical protein [bacterium]
MTSQSKSQRFIYTGPPTRIDKAVRDRYPELGRRKIHELSEAGLIFLNGRAVQAGAEVTGGQEIAIIEFPEKIRLRPELVSSHEKLEIIVANEELLVIDKPRMLHCIRLKFDASLTLADLIAHFHPETLSASADLREAGLINRLDFYTSGLILAARNAESYKKFREASLAGQITKTYLLLVEGHAQFDETQVATPIYTEDLDRSQAPTKFKLVKNFSLYDSPCAILEAQSTRFARHQIRRHASELGHPLVGDALYGSEQELSQLGLGENQGFLLRSIKLEFNLDTSLPKVIQAEAGEFLFEND